MTSLKIEAVSLSEALVKLYLTTLRNIPDDTSVQQEVDLIPLT
jgi:hypothetical protein